MSELVPEDEHPFQNASPPLEQVAEVRFQLSSKHLTLSSVYFRKMLKGQWKESVPSNSVYEEDASEWDVEAVLILMNIIHGRIRSVPRVISLEMLTKIAVLVDYYECHEVIELHVENWIKNLSQNLPDNYDRHLVLWLSVSWIFSRGTIFEAITKVVIKESRGFLRTLELPIPPKIIGKELERK